MENIKETVAKNLLKLRKKNKLTQAELSEKINYSDKAVSRWESGEVTPDIETLNKIAEVYNVSITSLFEQNLDVQNMEKISKKEAGNRRAIILLAVSFVWLLVILIFVYSNILFNKTFWEVFVYGVPATALITMIFSFIWGAGPWKFILLSAFIWTVLASIYLSFLTYNIWMIFLLGAPIQVAIVLWSSIKTKK